MPVDRVDRVCIITDACVYCIGVVGLLFFSCVDGCRCLLFVAVVVYYVLIVVCCCHALCAVRCCLLLLFVIVLDVSFVVVV